MGVFNIYLSNILNHLNNIKDNFLYFIISHYSSMFKNLQILFVTIENNHSFFLKQILLAYIRKFKELYILLILQELLSYVMVGFCTYLNLGKLYSLNLQSKNQFFKYQQDDSLFSKIIFSFRQRLAYLRVSKYCFDLLISQNKTKVFEIKKIYNSNSYQFVL